MKLTKQQIKQIIKEELEMINNTQITEAPSMEHITPENIKMVIDVLVQLGYIAVPAAAAAMGVSKMLDKTGKPERPEK